MLQQQIQPTGSSTWEENFQRSKINSTLYFVINKVHTKQSQLLIVYIISTPIEAVDIEFKGAIPPTTSKFCLLQPAVTQVEKGPKAGLVKSSNILY